ncbi:GGDEF domain-containing protein [Aliagarivorans taiwanensis]|uniref:GGDEF domain-containing protein n=1 Tax=Aliagarivorans taiwanensis TaxID=561966 RepID=UPI00047E2B2C|nr:GGDEF domain-containing protein [Aliagarivorans taiwanensis]
MFLLAHVERILAIGTTQQAHEDQYPTRIVNLLALWAVPLTTINGIFQALSFDISPLFISVYLGMLALAYFTALLWNHLRWHEFAKLWIFTIFSLDITLTSTYIFGMGSGVYWHLLITFPVAFLFWPKPQQLTRWLVMLLALCFALIVFSYQGRSMVILSSEEQNEMLVSVFITSCVLLAITGHLFIRDIHHYQSRLFAMANTDELTGILNRRALERQFEPMRQQHSPIAVLMFDIDDFKQINDNYGHPIGDQALCHIANEFKQQQPDDALFARMGGDEFAMIWPCPDIQHACALAQSLLAHLAKQPLAVGDTNITINISMGLCCDEKRKDIDRLLIQADDALYEAKRAGKHCYRTSGRDSQNLSA